MHLVVALLLSAQLAVPVMPERGLCAHRGVSDTHPENTIAAFEEAIRLGAHMIEFDVQFTKDKKMVVIHDYSVDRTTNGKGKVADLTFAEVRALDAGNWKNAKFAGAQVPTLREALAVMPQNIWLNVHLKGGREMGAEVAKAIKESGRLHQAFMACGNDAAKAAREIAPEILICNMDRQSTSMEYVNETIARKCDFIQLLGKRNPDLEAPVKVLKEAGVKINFYSADNENDIRILFEAGVEFPLVDHLGSLMKASEPYGITPWKPVFAKDE